MKRSVAFLVAFAVLAVGCSNDDESAPPTSPPSATQAPTSTSEPSTPTSNSSTSPPTNPSTTAPITSAPSTSPSTEPPDTTIPEAIEPVLQRLLDRYDEAVTAILADPSVASDPSHPAVRDYLALFAPESEFAHGALDSWAEEGELGHFYRPGPGGALVASTMRELNGSSENEASFTVCSVSSMEVVDADGNPIESQGGVAFVEAVAVRIDGEWVFRELTQSSGDCPRPGTDE